MIEILSRQPNLSHMGHIIWWFTGWKAPESSIQILPMIIELSKTFSDSDLNYPERFFDGNGFTLFIKGVILEPNKSWAIIDHSWSTRIKSSISCNYSFDKLG